MTNIKKVMIAMSGGVDSAVSAYLLKRDGFDVTGVTMCLGLNNFEAKKTLCCGPKEIEDAKRICNSLSIKHYVFNFSEILEDKVIKNFVEEYRLGNTPNPCVRCNKFLKFGLLLNQAKAMEFDYIATGHYAQIEKYKQNICLKTPKDKKKDQTYFLYSINKESLSFILFPLANYFKDEVRKIAKELNLPVAEKRESQDVCFITGKDYKSFLKTRGIENLNGDIVDLDGNILGKHTGITNYTIGQHKGLGLSTKEPLFVQNIKAEKNLIIVSKKGECPAKGLILDDVNFFVDEEIFPKEIFIKTRYRQTLIKGAIFFSKGYKDLYVVFNEPQDFISKGQSCVIYDGDFVLGGGIIKDIL
jgi:tRNA-uridine 2-sulfurtransferase